MPHRQQGAELEGDLIVPELSNRDSSGAASKRARWQVALTMLLLAVALLWPAAINQRPAYFFDSAGYLSSGTKALALLESRVKARLQPADAAAPVSTVRQTDTVMSIRAIAYGLFTAVLAAPGHSLWLVIVAHALITVFLIWEFWRIRAPHATPHDEAIATFFVAFATSAPWFVSYAMPDILAGAAILGMAILTFAALQQQIFVRLIVVAIVAFAVAAHASHILIIGLITGAALVELGYEHWRGISRWSWVRALWVVAPLIIGLAVVLTLSVGGFGSVSVAPKRLPFALARSIEDGPGKWYLAATCDEKRWAVCPFFERTGQKGPELIFARDGLLATATPAEMEAVRAQEMTIVRAATMAYPWVQIRAAVSNSVQQFFRFGLGDNSFAYEIERRPDGSFHLKRGAEPFDVRPAMAFVVYGTIGLALVYLGSIVRTLTFSEAGTLRLVLAGLVANAAVTGTLSTLTSRYQGRVIWVVPVVALGLWLARRSRRPTAS